MAVPCNIRGSASQLFYQDHQSAQYQALLAITELPHPDRSILGAFLIDAKDPRKAARYFLRETLIDGTSRSVRTRTIWEFLSDWKNLVSLFRPITATGLCAETERLVYDRDGGRCCVTQACFNSPADSDLRFVHIVLPRVFMNPDLVEGGRLSEMLYAFLSKDSIESFRSILSLDTQKTERLDNLCLLSVPAFKLVEAGEVWFETMSWDQRNSPHRQSYIINTNPYRYTTLSEMPIASSAEMMLIEDKTNNQTPVPHKDLFGLHALFSNSLAWIEVKREMIQQSDRPSAQSFGFPSLSQLLFCTIKPI